MAGALYPGKNRICEVDVAGISFQLVDKEAGVESDPAVTPEKYAKPLYSQLLRSFWRCRGG